VTFPPCRLVHYLLGGGVAGLVALGIGGRLAMAALMLARGERPDFTIGGSFNVIAVGVCWGLAGGALGYGLQHVIRRAAGRLHHSLVALGVLVVSVLSTRAGRSALTDLGELTWLAATLAVACFMAYGLLLHRLVRQRSPDRA
jgi:hypothetical protein